MQKAEIELMADHTHAGVIYPAGARLILDVDQAEWLVSRQSAVRITAASSVERQALSAAPEAKPARPKRR